MFESLSLLIYGHFAPLYAIVPQPLSLPSLVTCKKLLPIFALHQLFPILNCQTSSPFTNHQPSTNHHQPSCYTMASSQFDTRASFSAPLSVATAAKVLLELPSLPSTRPRLRRRESTRGAIVGLRASTPTMAFRRSDHPGPEVLQL